MVRFKVCGACHRHVKVEEASCPFCAGAGHTAGRTGTAAAFIVGLGLCLGACSSGDDGSDSAAYGPPPFGGSGGADATADGSGGTGGTTDAGNDAPPSD